jgi:sugar-specific transcriptional regulator TrmB
MLTFILILLVVIFGEIILNSLALENLHDLGLTATQAKVYLAILKENGCTFGHLSKISNVARSEVYREVVYLEKAGLVEKTLDRPKIVKALPVKFALKTFVENRKKKLESDISNLEKVLIEFLSSNCPSVKKTFENKRTAMEFILLSSRNLILSKVKSMLDEAKEEVLIRHLPRKLCSFLEYYSDTIINALKSNVKFNIITTTDSFSKNLANALQNSIGHNLRKIELRNSSSIPFGIIIIDQKHLLFETYHEDIFSEKPILYTTCPSILTTMYYNFKKDWFNIEKIESPPLALLS